MKKNLKKLMVLGVVAGSLSLVSCRETTEDDHVEPMHNEMQEEEHMNKTMDHETMQEGDS